MTIDSQSQSAEPDSLLPNISVTSELGKNYNRNEVEVVKAVIEAASIDDMQIFENLIGSLSIEQGLKLLESVQSIRSGSSYISLGWELHIKIAALARICGTQDGRIFFESNPESPGMEKYEYHHFVTRTLESIKEEFRVGSPDLSIINILCARVFQVLWLTMDSLFLLYNKPESETFIKLVIADIQELYKKIEDIFARNDEILVNLSNSEGNNDLARIKEIFTGDNSPAARMAGIALARNSTIHEILMEEQANFARKASRVLTANTIIYAEGDLKSILQHLDTTLKELKELIDSELISPVPFEFYRKIAEGNQILLLAKHVAISWKQKEKEDVAFLLSRNLNALYAEKSIQVRPFLGISIPANLKDCSDDFYELITAYVTLQQDISTEQLLEGLEIFMNSDNWIKQDEKDVALGYRNERWQGFFLLLIEEMLKLLQLPDRKLSQFPLRNYLKPLVDSLRDAPYWGTMFEEYSRLNLLVANAYGRACNEISKEISVLEKKGKTKISKEEIRRLLELSEQKDILLTDGKNAYCNGIQGNNDPERTKKHAGIFLDAYYQDDFLSLKQKPQKKKPCYVDEWYDLMQRKRHDVPSLVEHNRSKQKDFVFDALRAVEKPKNIHEFERYQKSLCTLISEYFHGFFNVHIVPYGSRGTRLWDKITTRYGVGMGFELILESQSLKQNILKTFEADELLDFVKFLTKKIHKTLANICPDAEKNDFRRLELEPLESPSSYAAFYKKLILDKPERRVFVQEKVRHVRDGIAGNLIFVDGKLREEAVGIGVECLIRFYDWKTGKLFGPGPITPQTGDNKDEKTIGVLEALDIFGEYKNIMKEQLKDIMNKLKGTSCKFSLNTRWDELLDNNYFVEFERLVRENDINPKNITVEILESDDRLDEESVIFNLKNLQQLGVRISIDDYAARQAKDSIARVVVLGNKRVIEVDSTDAVTNQKHLVNEIEIKLDGINVGRLENDFESMKWEIQVLKKRWFTVCFEKISNKKQAQLAWEAGVDMIQGYYYSKPQPICEYLAKVSPKKTALNVLVAVESIKQGVHNGMTGFPS